MSEAHSIVTGTEGTVVLAGAWIDAPTRAFALSAVTFTAGPPTVSMADAPAPQARLVVPPEPPPQAGRRASGSAARARKRSMNTPQKYSRHSLPRLDTRGKRSDAPPHDIHVS